MSWLWVACGGAIGATLRYMTSMWFMQNADQFPWATWIVNILGCVLAGGFFAFSLQYPVLQHEARLFFMVGILGGFTTFSSFGLETFQLIKSGQYNLALMYVVSSIMIGLLGLVLSFFFTQFYLTNK